MSAATDDFLGGQPPVVLVNDKVQHPHNPKRFHYRVQALSAARQATAAADGKPAQAAVPQNHIHVDLEATMRDTTVDVGPAECRIAADGRGEFVVPAAADDDQLHSAKVIIATCHNLGDTVLYGKTPPASAVRFVDGGSRLALAVDTHFEDEMVKMQTAYSDFTMQSYAGPTPIEHSRHLKYMKDMGADASKFYTELNERYGRSSPIIDADATLRGGRQSTVAAEAAEAADHDTDAEAGRRLDTETWSESTGANTVFNCDTQGTSVRDPGCDVFTDPAITVIDHLNMNYDGTNFDVTVKCVECAVTVEGASIFATLTSDFSIEVPDVIGDVIDAGEDLIDDAGDIADDVVDAGGDLIDDAGDVADDIFDGGGDVFDDCCGWRALSDTLLTAEIDYSFGADMKGLAVDFAVLMELVLTPAPGTASDYTYSIFAVFVPYLGYGASVFGVGLGAGLRLEATVDPDISYQGGISAQAGSKLVFDGAFTVAGSIDLTSLELGTATGDFNVAKWIDTPRITSSGGGDFTFLFNLEVQCGVWADVVSGTGAKFYGAIGVPVIVDGTVMAQAPPDLLSSIPAEYCDADADSSSNFFFGDCTQPNNLQAQVSIRGLDVYGKFVAGASFGLSGYGVTYTKSISYVQSIDQSTISGFGLEVGPYTLTYCDCLQWTDGVNCAEQGTGSQCAVDAFPPASMRVAPAYTEDAPPSGMALAWENESVGAIDAQTYLTPAMIFGIVLACAVVVAAIIAIVVVSTKGTKRTNVTKLAAKYGGQKKTMGGKKKAKPKKSHVTATTFKKPKRKKHGQGRVAQL